MLLASARIARGLCTRAAGRVRVVQQLDRPVRTASPAATVKHFVFDRQIALGKILVLWLDSRDQLDRRDRTVTPARHLVSCLLAPLFCKPLHRHSRSTTSSRTTATRR